MLLRVPVVLPFTTMLPLTAQDAANEITEITFTFGIHGEESNKRLGNNTWKFSFNNQKKKKKKNTYQCLRKT